MDCVIGVVVIGRNEGDRLRVCLKAAPFGRCTVVYVDSGSTDGSLEFAARFGAQVVALEETSPFTAGRARNAGLQALKQVEPGVHFVQFLDGDCELDEAWLTAGVEFLERNAAYAAVCGRVRERDPDGSVYNLMCEWEWRTPPGDIRACGGNVLMRVAAFEEAGGFREDLIAGEEPELCLRLRQLGWRIHCLDTGMVLHDASLVRFTQWWRRTTRSGHAFAQGAWLHGRGRERHWVAETLRAVFYGGAVPLAALVLWPLAGPAALLLLLVYPAQVLRLARRPGGFTRAFYLVLGRFAEFVGVLGFLHAQATSSRPRLIEYK
jgi:GT2 family glycosyltransferase